jgi:transcriptional regulator with XRE-family HTH domain
VKTLAERVDWILKNRRRPDGRKWSARGLSDAAGLSPAHVGMMQRGEAKAVKGDTLRGVAEAAGVSLAWLVTGDGSPDSDDTARTPSTTDDPEPIMANVPGWAEVERADSEEHPDITDTERKNAREVAKYMLHRPAVMGDLWELVRQMRRVNDPVWLAQKLQESNARVQALLAKAPEQLAWEREQIAKKQAKERR